MRGRYLVSVKDTVEERYRDTFDEARTTARELYAENGGRFAVVVLDRASGAIVFEIQKQ